MNLKRIFDIKALLLLPVIALSACSGGDSLPLVEPARSDADIVLTLFTAKNSDSPVARSSGHEYQVALQNENLVDIDGGDYRVLVFDTNGRLLERFMPTSFIKVNTADYSEYSIEGRITQTQFMGRPDGSYEFQLMVLANWESLSGVGCYERDFELLPGKTFVGDVVSAARDKAYTVSAVEGWRPYVDGNKGIPMFGLGTLRITAEDIEKSSPEAPVNVGSVSLLRAMAKIEIIDNITVPTEAGSLPEIKGAALTGHFANGTFIPDLEANIDWVDETVQVVSPTAPTTPVKAGSSLKFFDAGKNADGLQVYAAYIPEHDLAGLADSQRPQAAVSVLVDGVVSDYTLHLSEYVDGKPATPLSMLLRNHIYRFEVVAVSAKGEEGEMTGNWTVCDMDNADINLEFN